MFKKLLVCGTVLAAAVLTAAESFRYRACLNGEWDAAFTTGGELPADVVWEKMRIPSTWGRKGRELWQVPDSAVKARFGWFRLRFHIPAEWRGRQVKFFFGHLEDANQVRLNGRVLHDSPYMTGSREIEATSAVKYGMENELLVRTAASGYCGIARDVFISAMPQTAIRYTLVRPSVRRQELALRVMVENRTGTPETLEISGKVLDGLQTVLTFPEQSVTVDREAPAELCVSWKNPILWGFGEYGVPHLYTLRMELKRNGRIVDVKHERFGFREFHAEGDKFMLNGKPIYLKGDLYTKTRDHAEHPAAVMAFLQRMRASNLNFFRWHTSERLDDPVWFEVADEVGFLMEPEMWRPFVHGEKHLDADDPAVKRLWEDYVIANYNHPSVVMWCVDNESFSVGLTSPENLRKIDLKKLARYDRLISHIRTLDPTRIVEINHNYSIWPFVRMNKFSRENFQVFNIHPYGNILKTINAEEKATGFRGEVPVLVGEIFGHDNPVDFVQDPKGAYAEQWRLAESYYRQIRDAAAADHVSGSILCAQTSSGFVGFSAPEAVQFGPWDDYAKLMKNGKPAGVRRFNVHPVWPSLSGRGVKVESYPGWGYYGGNFGLNLNWFDPHAPMYRNNLIDKRIRQAYFEVGNQNVPPLPETRMPELVVAFGDSDAPRPGELLWLHSPERIGELEGALTDPEGTAWFRLNGTGTYRLTAGTKEKHVTVSALPPLTEKPGYSYITWVDMGGSAPELLKRKLDKPAVKSPVTLLTRGEFLQNRGFEYWQDAGAAQCWASGGRRSDDAVEGGHSMELAGNSTYITQQIRLEKGKTYRISGAVKGRGNVQIKSGDYKIKFSIQIPGTAGKWERFSRLYVADGTERYFYIINGSASKEEVVLYDDLSVRELPMPVRQAPLNPGPFPLGKRGFIRNWLVLGPFPNIGDEREGYQAAATDYLRNDGGEASSLPAYGRQVQAVFGEGSYWTAGEYLLRWEQLHSSGDRVQLDAVNLPEAVITGKPASHVAAYLSCVIESSDARDVKLGVGSDDGYVLYLNGQKIGSCFSNRGAAEDQEVYDVRLKKGANILMLKAIQESGGWEVMVRLTAPDGTPPAGVKILLPAEKSILTNGDFSEAPAGKLKDWHTAGCREEKIVPAPGSYSLRLAGNIAQATRLIRLEPGASYKVEGLIYSPLPRKVGVIGIRDLKYNWLLSLKSGGRMNEWEKVSGIFKVPEDKKEFYFYCINWYSGQESVLYYADVKMVKLSESR